MNSTIGMCLAQVIRHYQLQQLGNLTCNGKRSLDLQYFFQHLFQHIEEENIQAVIIYGSAVRKPRQITVYRKKFYFLGDLVSRTITEKRHKPRDFDFIILCTDTPKTNKVVIPKKTELVPSDYGHYERLVCNRCDLVFAGETEISQHLNDWSTHVALCAISEGILLFGETNLPMKCPRRVEWTFGNDVLCGEIADWEIIACKRCGNQMQCGDIKFCAVCGRKMHV